MNEKIFNFKFTENETNIILNALSEQAFKVSAPVINAIQMQAAEQLKPEEKAEEEK